MLVQGSILGSRLWGTLTAPRKLQGAVWTPGPKAWHSPGLRSLQSPPELECSDLPSVTGGGSLSPKPGSRHSLPSLDSRQLPTHRKRVWGWPAKWIWASQARHCGFWDKTSLGTRVRMKVTSVTHPERCEDGSEPKSTPALLWGTEVAQQQEAASPPLPSRSHCPLPSLFFNSLFSVFSIYIYKNIFSIFLTAYGIIHILSVSPISWIKFSGLAYSHRVL